MPRNAIVALLFLGDASEPFSSSFPTSRFIAYFAISSFYKMISPSYFATLFSIVFVCISLFLSSCFFSATTSPKVEAMLPCLLVLVGEDSDGWPLIRADILAGDDSEAPILRERCKPGLRFLPYSLENNLPITNPLALVKLLLLLIELLLLEELGLLFDPESLFSDAL
jgi:hypothetical protein